MCKWGLACLGVHTPLHAPRHMPLVRGSCAAAAAGCTTGCCAPCWEHGVALPPPPPQASTLVGNWLETRELRNSVLKDVISRKCTASLSLDAYTQRVSQALQAVELTKVAEGPYVQFGDYIQLVHLATGCTLAADTGDRDPRAAERACAATGAPEVRAPVARNTFCVLPFKPAKTAVPEPDYGDSVLRYGAKVRLAAHPTYTGDPTPLLSDDAQPLCLFSKPVSMTHSAKYVRGCWWCPSARARRPAPRPARTAARAGPCARAGTAGTSWWASRCVTRSTQARGQEGGGGGGARWWCRGVGCFFCGVQPSALRAARAAAPRRSLPAARRPWPAQCGR